jgi:N-glycosidase YbiA
MIDNFRGKYRFLSNFYPLTMPVILTQKHFSGGLLDPCLCIAEPEEYFTSEHAYQAAKYCHPSYRKLVREAKTPGNAKRIGNIHKTQLRRDWESVKLDIMYDLVHQKFIKNEDLKGKLLTTGTQILVEGNTWGDTFWGVCNGTGSNYLGRILMRIRGELSNG